MVGASGTGVAVGGSGVSVSVGSGVSVGVGMGVSVGADVAVGSEVEVFVGASVALGRAAAATTVAVGTAVTISGIGIPAQAVSRMVGNIRMIKNRFTLFPFLV